MFAAHQEAGQTCIQVFFFRNGNNWGNRAYFPRADKSLPPEDVLESFIAQFTTTSRRRIILLSHEIASRRLLSTRSAQGGAQGDGPHASARPKRELVEHARVNAQRRWHGAAEHASQHAIYARLAELLDLDEPPGRIRSTTIATSRGRTRSAR